MCPGVKLEEFFVIFKEIHCSALSYFEKKKNASHFVKLNLTHFGNKMYRIIIGN